MLCQDLTAHQDAFPGTSRVVVLGVRLHGAFVCVPVWVGRGGVKDFSAGLEGRGGDPVLPPAPVECVHT